MPAPCASRPCAMAGTPPIRSPATTRRPPLSERTCEGAPLSFPPSLICSKPYLLNALFASSRQNGRALEHGPFFVAGTDQRETIGRRAVPGGAKAVLRQFPGALALVSRADRLALHLAVRRESHLEFDVRGRRRRE